MALDTDDIDVVLLEGASAALGHRVVRDGGDDRQCRTRSLERTTGSAERFF
jgi:hypothetical protein